MVVGSGRFVTRLECERKLGVEMQRAAQRYLDNYLGDGAAERITLEAATDLARVAPLTLINVLDDRAAREVHAVAAGLARAYPRVWALGARAGNTILVGCARPLNLDRIAQPQRREMRRGRFQQT